jgi:hypothetical protein
MSNDDPYITGFLEEITDCHFAGGQWFGVSCGDSGYGISSSTITVSFPGEAGGTPGLILLNNSISPFPAGGTDTSPITLTPKLLAGTLTTGGGLKLTGLGRGVGLGAGSSAQTAVLFQLDGAFPAVPFHVRLSLVATITAPVAGFTVFTAVKDSVKKGVLFGVNNLPPIQSQASNTFFGGTSVTSDFVVDPKKLTVTGPF